jgi:outer membrane protein OmpA-like peptidoglycan-associated protein
MVFMQIQYHLLLYYANISKTTGNKAKATAKVAAVKVDAAQQQRELSKLADTKKVGDAIEVNLKGDLLFARGSDKLTDAAKKKIAEIGKVLAKDPNAKIHVMGYTDNRGDAAKNQKLSEWRATAVKNALSENGVSGKKITVEGKGVADPVASNDTAEGRAANRRAVIRITQ